MTSLWILILYIIILTLQIIFLIRSCKNKSKWIVIIVFEIVSIIISAFSAAFFNCLPGKGYNPTLTYIGEFLFSFFSMIVYVIMLALTLLMKLFLHIVDSEDKKIRK